MGLQTTITERNLTISHHRNGYRQTAISKRVNKYASTVKHTIERYRNE